MSIATQLTALAANRDAIKAAIEAKGVADAGDTLAEFPAAIASIPSGGGDEPKPWYGSGTTFWLHFDGDSYSHNFAFSFVFTSSNSFTVNWGDGTSDTLAAASGSTRSASHTYSNGDYICRITGYESVTIGTNGGTFGSETGGFSNAMIQRRDAVVQFETDVDTLVGNGNDGYSPIPANRKIRHMRFPKCTSMSMQGIGVCSALETLEMPELVEIGNSPWGVGNRVFPSLVSISFPKLASISNSGTDSIFRYMSSLKSFSVGGALTSVPNFFLSESGVTSISLPSSVVTFGSNFMAFATSFSGTFVFPEGVTSIAGAFNSGSIECVDFPSTITSIDGWTCYRSNLQTMIVRATTPPTLANTNPISQFGALKIYVPYGCGEAYKTATNWSAKASLIYELNQDGTIPQA